MTRKRNATQATPVPDSQVDKALWVPCLSAVYAISGFCALIYQTIWIHEFSIVFGSTIFSTSVVIAVFFGGIALGNFLFGKWSVRAMNPVWLFALLEIGIGLYAFAFPFFLGLSGKLYAAAYSFAAGGLTQATLVRMILALLVLIVPTTLMGGTFPLLVRYLVRRLNEVGGRTGLLYGVNALGGAVGAILSAYVFMRYFGNAATNMLAGALSVAAGLAAAAFSRGGKHLEVPESTEAPAPARDGHTVASKAQITLTMRCFALTGLVSMAYEIYWLRFLALVMLDTIYLYTGIVAVFVFGIGLGSVLMGRAASRTRWPLALFGLIELGTGAFTVIAVYATALAYGPITRSLQEAGTSVLPLLFALLFIPALLMGAKFPVVARIVAPDVQGVGSQAGRAYALNTLGAVAGLLLCGFCFFPLFGLQGTLFVLFAGSMLSASLLIRADPNFRRPFLTILPVLLAIALPLLSSSILHGKLPNLLLEKEATAGGQKLREVREGLVGTTSVTHSPAFGFVLSDNGVVIGEGQRGNFKTGGYIPVLIRREAPERVLSLAFGAGVSSAAARALSSLKQITCVDISRQNIETALDYFPENAGLRKDPRAEFVIDDAYNYVKYSKASFDLILMEPTPPMYSFRCASLYTQEFYQHAANRLAPDGLFSQVIPLGNLSSAEARGVMKTFASVFPECLLWFNGWDCVMIGSRQRIMLDAAEIVRRLQFPAFQEALARQSQFKYHLPANFLSGLLLTTEDFRKVAVDGVLYTDDRSALRYSTGKEDNLAVIEQIHACLTPWEKLHSEVFVVQQLGGQLTKLTGLREMLMLAVYRGDTRYRKMLRYIDEVSLQKAVDYENLIRELQAKNQLTAGEKETLAHAKARMVELHAEQ